MIRVFQTMCVLACLGFGSGCALTHDVSAHDELLVTRAICVLQPTAGNHASGLVTFEQMDGYVFVTAEVRGLTPGLHGFHIHEFGDVRKSDGKGTGGHFNPGSHSHAGPGATVRHAGDLGNIEANQDGTAVLTWNDPVMKLNGPHSIIGRGMIVHAGEDDLMTQPTGGAGARVAQGVIGIGSADN